jgi:Na+-translocating ferredoxin:NAD+ oxidoreductase RnfD subunit
MSAHAAPAPGGLSLTVRGRTYPVLLPKLKDPRLHLAATITSLQVIGQIGFHFRLSITQILISLLTCAVLEVGIAAWRQHVILWPASALLTGNGVAFVLRVPGTRHGDWWSLRGWWIYAATAAVALLSKYLLQWRGAHVFNPSNIGLVLCFLILGRSRSEPLDFWWGPTSTWLVLALAIILAGGFAILSRLKLLGIAIGVWVSFALGIGLLAATGHAMTARWHLGPISGFHFWWVLVTSPEVLVFLFFMITDPKTAPRDPRARIAYAVSLGLLGALLIAPMRTEYWSKVALLGSLAIVCAAMPLLRLVTLRRPAVRTLALAGAGTIAAYVAGVIALGLPARLDAQAARPLPKGSLPAISILPSRGVQSELDRKTAELIAHDLVAVVPAKQGDRVDLWLEPGGGQSPPVAVAELAGRTYRLSQNGTRWAIKPTAVPTVPPVQTAAGPALPGFRLTDVAAQVGLDFRQGSFRYGVTNEPAAMMGGGLCWLDYNNDGWLDLFVVNSYADDNLPAWNDHGGLPTSALFENDHGRFVNVSKQSHAGLPLKGEGCVTADFDGDGHTDLYVTTGTNDALLWNNGDGTFTEGARKAGVISFGFHSGATVADVNGDGRPDLYVAGYTNMASPIPSSVKGFPGDHQGVRDLLFLNLGHRHFEEVGTPVGLDKPPYDHSLGAVFSDFNGDGRPDLYVANDEDPNRLYLNEPGGPLGFHFVDRARAEKVADPNAGMGIAEADYNGDGLNDLFVSNSRGQTHAIYRSDPLGAPFADSRKLFTAALGANRTGWGDSWVDLTNSGALDLVVANGAIPVTNLAKDAGPIQVLAQQDSGGFRNARVLRDVRVNGRGVAAADYDNDGRVDLAINSIGGRLILLHNDGPTAHWLEVQVEPFSPGAVVTLVRADGRSVVQEVHAGSSYLSSEDPRVHFGLGNASSVATVIVRYPDGTVRTIDAPRVDRLLVVTK